MSASLPNFVLERQAAIADDIWRQERIRRASAYISRVQSRRYWRRRRRRALAAMVILLAGIPAGLYALVLMIAVIGGDK